MTMTDPERETEIAQLKQKGWTCKSCRHDINDSCAMGHEYPASAATCYKKHGDRGFEYEPGSDENEHWEAHYGKGQS